MQTELTIIICILLFFIAILIYISSYFIIENNKLKLEIKLQEIKYMDKNLEIHKNINDIFKKYTKKLDVEYSEHKLININNDIDNIVKTSYINGKLSAITEIFDYIILILNK